MKKEEKTSNKKEAEDLKRICVAYAKICGQIKSGHINPAKVADVLEAFLASLNPIQKKEWWTL